MDVDGLRARLDEAPQDDGARAELGRRLAAEGDRDGAAEAFYLAACGARMRGDEEAFRVRLSACLDARPDWPLLFTEAPAPPAPPGEARGGVLVVVPESRVRGPIVRLLRDAGWLVEEAATVGSARAVLREWAADVLVVAPVFLDGDAFAVAQAARRANRRAAVVLLTCAAKGEMPGPGDRVDRLVDERLDRPLAPARLLEAVHAARWRQHHAPAPAPRPASPQRPRREGRPLALPRLPAHWLSLGPTALRAGLLVAIGYTILLSLDAWLEAPATIADGAAVAVTPNRPASLPLELDADGERLLWTRLTSTEASADFEIQVTAVTRELVAQRAYRQARRRGVLGPVARAEIEAAMERLHAEQRATFEIHVAARGEADFDPIATAASVAIQLADGRVGPLALPDAQSLRIVREGAGRGRSRTRSFHFTVSFPRGRLASAEVFALTLEVAGTPHVVYVQRAQLGED